ncbi:MAG: utilization substance protein B-like protein [Verrucomicrobiota bacterium]|jgi:N utilization substance protein B
MSDTRTSSQRPKSGLRRAAREAAVQFLYFWDIQEGGEPLPDSDFWRLRSGEHDPEETSDPKPPPLPPKAKAFAEALIQGVMCRREGVDETIIRYAKNYELHRIAAVDRNILRLAVYELLHSAEVPPVVAIHEAIEIAKKFGTEDSSRFVNGILDRIRADLTNTSRPPATKANHDSRKS